MNSSKTRAGTLSVVVPVFNEEGNAAPLVAGITAAVRPLDIPFELIVVDDGSSDGTSDVLRDLIAETPELVVVRLRRNFGQASALQAGFDRARGGIIVTLDGDLQNDPKDIPRLLERIEAGADVVSGWRVNRQDAMVLRKVPSWIANRLIRWVTRVPIHDQGCSLKAYRREVVERLDLYSDLHRFITILTMPQGAAIEEIEVRHHPRIAGESKYGISRVLKVLVDLTAIQMLTRFRESPTRWFGLLGIPFLLGSIATGVAAIGAADRFVVLPTVSLLLALVFVSCLFAALLGEAIIDTLGRVERNRIVVREWKGTQ
jgi:glycosyltransferase involved in cell wall biosynthesis